MVHCDLVKDEVLLFELEKIRNELNITSNNSNIDPIHLFKNKTIPDSDMIRSSHMEHTMIQLKIYHIAGIIGANKITNHLIYHPNSVMDWHTNSNDKGKRIYLTYSYGDSIFRYFDKNKIVNSYDYKQQWTIREFEIGDKLFWHTIATNDYRVVIGLRKN